MTFRLLMRIASLALTLLAPLAAQAQAKTLRVVPHAIEFWQGRADRLHDRLLYTASGAGWKIERLAP